MQGKKFKDGTGLGQYLHENPKFPACVAKKLYAYARGMDTEEVGPSAFQAAYKEFTNSGYRLRALLKGLALSPEFFNMALPVKEASASQTNSQARLASSP